MHQYHAHAKLIRNETERLLQRATAREDKRRKTQPVMVLRRPALPAARRPDAQLRRPRRRAGADRSDGVRAQAVGDDPDLPARDRPGRAAGAAHARAARRAGGVATGSCCATTPEAGRRFVELLCDERDRANPSRLEQMQDLGLLAAIMPEWEPSTGRVQHDIYHVYTVDQHALYAVGRLHALARGDHAAAFPVPTETIKEVKRPVALALGTLLHDVGKPYGSPHSEIGAGLAVAICQRLGIDEEDIQRVDFLVRQHLVMGQMSQRRDLEDLGMISDFARAVRRRGEPARAVLADVLRSGVGRARRDVELEGDAARRAVHAHADVPAARPRSARLRARGDRSPSGSGARRACWRAARRGGGGRRRWRTLFAGLPGRYFAENAETRIASHVGLIRARRDAGQELDDRRLARHAPRDDGDGAGRRSTCPACSPTSPACCTPTGSRSSTRPSTRGSRPTRTEAPEALDVFRVRDSMGRPVTAEARWTQGARATWRPSCQGGSRRRRWWPAARARSRWRAGRRRSCRPSARSTTTSAATSPSSR